MRPIPPVRAHGSLLLLGLVLFLQGCFLLPPPSIPAGCVEGSAFPETMSTAAILQVGPYVPDQLLVRYRLPQGDLRTSAREAELGRTASAVRGDHGLQLVRAGDLNRPELVRTRDLAGRLEALRNDPRVVYAHPNYLLQPLFTPNDTLYGDQWTLGGFGLEQAWDIERGKNVVIAVIDSGFAVNHPDLAAKMVQGYDFNGRDQDVRPLDTNWHGTHVTGIAAAIGNNGIGISGVAPGATVRILPVKVFNDFGSTGMVADLVDALVWSVGLGVPEVPNTLTPADIINMSLAAGGKAEDIPALSEATFTACRQGAILVAAGGNNGTSNGTLPPANAPSVIAVGSVDEDATRSSFSTYGTGDLPTVEVMAPGGSGTTPTTGCGLVLSTVPGDSYGCLEGTSMAAPFVSGVVALLLSREPDLSLSDVRARLANTAYYDGGFMNPDMYGAGVVCADRALAKDTGRRSRPCGS